MSERLTREEWEDIESEEYENSQRRAQKNGDLWYTLYFNGNALRSNPPEARESLLDLKLAQARVSILQMIEEAGL